MQKMTWHALLSANRVGEAVENSSMGREESPYLLDLDRISFSSFFRRLQDKTQVHPLSQGARVRSRLTHSIEVASVGRSLGFAVGKRLRDEGYDIPETISPHDFGYIVQVACLSHDIGNPPFGHAGEAAIAHWFDQNGARVFDATMSELEKRDFTRFEGNAQGFRILNRLDYYRSEGGFRMTHAALGAFMKYPADCAPKQQAGIAGKKAGFCQSERVIVEEVARALGLIPHPTETVWCRHPLAYLMEAADDICYRVADLEDGVMIDCVPFKDVEKHLAPLAWSHKHGESIEARRAHLLSRDWYQKKSETEKLGFLRSKAISNLVKATVDAFMAAHDDILMGQFDGELLDHTPFREEAEACKTFARDAIFGTRQKMEIEAASFDVLGYLLDRFSAALIDFESVEGDMKKVSPYNRRLLALLDSPRVSRSCAFTLTHSNPFLCRKCVVVSENTYSGFALGLFSFNTLRRIARVRVKRSSSLSPSPQRMARCKKVKSSEKRCKTSRTASLLFKNTSRHITGSDAAMRVKSWKPDAENLMTSFFSSSLRSLAVPTIE